MPPDVTIELYIYSLTLGNESVVHNPMNVGKGGWGQKHMLLLSFFNCLIAFGAWKLWTCLLKTVENY